MWDLLLLPTYYQEGDAQLAVISSMQALLYHHFLSYDMNIRPTVMFHIPPMLDPLAELSAKTFCQLIWLLFILR
jgi:hypothetical protein